MSSRKHRTIVHDLLFGELLAEIERDEKRLDEFVSGIEWVLCRKPEIGHKVTDNVWFIPAFPAKWMKHDYNVYYTFTDDTVYLLSIKIAKASPL